MRRDLSGNGREMERDRITNRRHAGACGRQYARNVADIYGRIIIINEFRREVNRTGG